MSPATVNHSCTSARSSGRRSLGGNESKISGADFGIPAALSGVGHIEGARFDRATASRVNLDNGQRVVRHRRFARAPPSPAGGSPPRANALLRRDARQVREKKFAFGGPPNQRRTSERVLGGVHRVCGRGSTIIPSRSRCTPTDRWSGSLACAKAGPRGRSARRVRSGQKIHGVRSRR